MYEKGSLGRQLTRFDVEKRPSNGIHTHFSPSLFITEVTLASHQIKSKYEHKTNRKKSIRLELASKKLPVKVRRRNPCLLCLKKSRIKSEFALKRNKSEKRPTRGESLWGLTSRNVRVRFNRHSPRLLNHLLGRIDSQMKLDQNMNHENIEKRALLWA